MPYKASITNKKQSRAKVVTYQRKLLDEARTQGRDLNADEVSKYDKLERSFGLLDKEIKDLEAKQLRHNVVAGREADMGQLQTRGQRPDPDDGNGGSRQQRRSARPNAPAEYRQAVLSYIRRGRSGLDVPESRAMSVGSDPSGGYLVTSEMEPMILRGLEEVNIVRSMARVIQTSSDRKIPLSKKRAKFTYLGESQEFGKTDPSLGMAQLGSHKVGGIILVSEELLQDSDFDIENFLAEEIAFGLGDAEEEAFFAGDGHDRPRGIVMDAGVGVTAASASAITSDELLDLYYSVKPSYRRHSTWAMADGTVKVLRKLKNATTGDYMWQPGLREGEPDVLLGRPVRSSPYMPDLAAASKPILLADWSYYWIADRMGVYIQRLEERYAEFGQVGFRAFTRHDGALLIDDAAKVLAMKAA